MEMRLEGQAKTRKRLFLIPTLLTGEVRMPRAASRTEAPGRWWSWESQAFIPESVTCHSHSNTEVTHRVHYLLMISCGKVVARIRMVFSHWDFKDLKNA